MERCIHETLPKNVEDVLDIYVEKGFLRVVLLIVSRSLTYFNLDRSSGSGMCSSRTE